MTSPVPLVSVLITAFNREAFIGEAIESVLGSSLRDFELIIVDDASSDATAAVAAQYVEKDPRLRMFVNETNVGDYQNRNSAAGHARGRYLKYVDSDDVIYPHGLEVMARCMESFPQAGLGLSAVPNSVGSFPLLLSPAEAYRHNFFGGDLFGRAPGSAIIRRSAFEAVGGFTGRRQVGDHELWLAMARRFPVVTMPRDLLWDRLHPDQEKHYDSIVEKAVMHEDIQLAALRSADCPLEISERDAALARLLEARARKYWYFLRRNGLRTAQDYRRRASLPGRAILSVASEKLLDTMGSRRFHSDLAL
ncbi:MAG: glycosyltransferase family A protein [Gemmatimonadaceae bacterium]